MVGRLGPHDIASIGLGNTIRMVVFILILSVTAGSMSLMSQARGAANKSRMTDIARQSVLAGIGLAVVVAFLGIIFSRPILMLIEQGGNLEVINSAHDYLIIIFLSTPFLVLNFVMDRLMQGAGDTVTPLILNVLLIVSNIILSYLLIFGIGVFPEMGLTGAAMGTLIVRAVIMVIGFVILHSGKNVVHIPDFKYRFNKGIIKDVFDIGIPSGLQGVTRRGANLALIGIITATDLKTLGAAVLAIGWQVEQLIIQPVVGMNVAGTSLIGQAIGKWDVKDAMQKGKTLIFSAIVLNTLLTIPIVIFRQEIIMFFDPSANETILQGASLFFLTVLLSLPLSVAAVIISGLMRGTGETRPALYSTILFRNIVPIGLAYLLALVLDYGPIGVWLSVVVGRVLDTIFMSYIWFGKKWLKRAEKLVAKNV